MKIVILAVLAMTSLLVFFGVTMFGLAEQNGLNTPLQTKYREIPYILTDGTSCTIIKGGTHSGMVGITCNYKGE
jgi:hypothetical protein